MSIASIKGRSVPVHLWSEIHEVDSEALTQLREAASLPWVFHHVAAMADVHAGKGATVGSVIAMKGAIAPAAIGVDIGCGMAALRTNLKKEQLPASLHAMRAAIEAAIPVGFNEHEKPIVSKLRDYRLVTQIEKLFKDYKQLDHKVHDLGGKPLRQIGTLGGGNHFIELSVDTEGRVWLMLHSGSRNLGKELAEGHVKRAKQLEYNAHLPIKDMAVFLEGTGIFDQYKHDLMWALEYARCNRDAMLDLYVQTLEKFFPEVKIEETVNCHHNYAAEEEHFGEKVIVTRKGAIRAGKGEMGIIPGAMGTPSYIVRGLGSEESFLSASHGAGRKMSRSQAKKMFTVEQLEELTAGVECRKDRGVLDEISAAYKPIRQVMDNQKDLVEPVAELRALLCIKG